MVPLANVMVPLAKELALRPPSRPLSPWLGKLYQRTSHRTETRAHLTTATGMSREMDMGFWLEQAEAEIPTGFRSAP